MMTDLMRAPTGALRTIAGRGAKAAFFGAATLSSLLLTDLEAAALVQAPLAPGIVPQVSAEAELVPARDVPTAAEAEPLAEAIGSGRASFYGDRFAGRPTASGEPFDPAQLTAAHRSLPLGSLVRVTHLDSGSTVVVRINDRGPFHGDRIIDLSKAAAKQLKMISAGTAAVKLELLHSI